MPLSAPAPRKLIHTRTVTCQGYERDDGLWDIEGHMTDVKTYTFPNRDRGGEIKAGEPVHGMWLRLTVDLEMTVHAAEAWTEYSPFSVCPEIAAAYSKLVGLRIGPGWNRRIKELFSGIKGCTHLSELLGPMATTTFQTLYKAREQNSDHLKDSASAPPLLGTCHAFDPQGEVVKWFFPTFAQSQQTAQEAEASPQ